MNITDLIEELKDNDLLEETAPKSGDPEAEIDDTPEHSDERVATELNQIPEPTEEELLSEPESVVEAEPRVEEQPNADLVANQKDEKESEPEIPSTAEVKPEQVDSNKEKYSALAKKFEAAINGLEAVEHLLNGIILEHRKKIEPAFDVESLRGSVHRLKDSTSDTEAANLEGQLTSSLENWRETLRKRDKKISTADLRVYVSEANPSENLLTSLARFYRTSPFSERVRRKFDFVATRLFTTADEKKDRRMIVDSQTIIHALEELYARWGCLEATAQTEQEENPAVILATYKYEDLIEELRTCKEYGDLIESGFFKRIKRFKRGIGKDFFSPAVIAKTIEFNVELGNRYDELAIAEKEKEAAECVTEDLNLPSGKLTTKSASKTAKLAEFLSENGIEPPLVLELDRKVPDTEPDTDSEAERADAKEASEEQKEEDKSDISSAAKKTQISKAELFKRIALAVGLIIAGYFILSAFIGSPIELTEFEQQMQAERAIFHKYVKHGKVSDGVFVGAVKDSWSGLSKKEKEDVVSKMFERRKEKGFSSIELKNGEDKTVAIGNSERIELKE